MDSVAIKIEKGSKEYVKRSQRAMVFQDVDLEILDDEILVLLGPSGCGKSTLLRIVAKLERLTSGMISGAGNYSNSQIGMVFQEPLLYPWLTAKENVQIGLAFSNNKEAKNSSNTSDLLREFGIDGVADSLPSELSGGQAQRVNLARALLVNPSILLLDEPFAALDPNTKARLQDWLLEIKSGRKLTMVLVTHDIEEALRLADRIVLMCLSPSTITKMWDIAGMKESGGYEHQSIKEEILENY
jgi:sulfate transport system ATP-binding protein